MCKNKNILRIGLFLVTGDRKVLIRKEGSQIMPIVVEMNNFDTSSDNLKKIGRYFSFYSAMTGFLRSVKLPEKLAINFNTDVVELLLENGISKKWVMKKIALAEKDFAAIVNNSGNLIPMGIKEIEEIVKKIKDNQKKDKEGSEKEFDFDKLFSKKDETIYRIDDTHMKLIETFLESFNGHPGDGDFFYFTFTEFLGKLKALEYEKIKYKKENNRGHEWRRGQFGSGGLVKKTRL